MTRLRQQLKQTQQHSKENKLLELVHYAAKELLAASAEQLV